MSCSSQPGKVYELIDNTCRISYCHYTCFDCFGPNANQCLECYTGFSLGNDSTCASCGPHCYICSDSIKFCQVCESGYGPDE